MDIILDPATRKMYDKCKYRVKLWEHQFKKQHGRIPSKLDIREADDEVKFAYKTYFNLKSNALEQSFKDIEGFESDEDKIESRNDGNELFTQEEDKLTVEEQEYVKLNEKAWGEAVKCKQVEVVEETKEENAINSLISKKLFNGSKFSKRNPRKSLSFHSRKSEVNLNEAKSLSQPVIDSNSTLKPSLSQEFVNEFTSSLNTNVKIINSSSNINATSLNIIQSVLSNDYKPRRALDMGWLQRVTEKNGCEVVESNKNNENDFLLSQKYVKLNEKVEKEFDSDELVENSDEESSQNVLPPPKRIKFVGNSTNNTNILRENNEVKKINPKNDLIVTRRKSYNFKEDDSETEKDPFDGESDDDPQFTPNSSNKNDVYDFDSDDSPKSSKKKSNSKKNLNGKIKKTQNIKQKEKTQIEDSQMEEYELEYSVKPRIKSTPRITNVKETIKKRKENVAKKPKSQQTNKEKLEEKVASGTLNENFVRIDLKKKIYARGQKKFTYSKYKKNMWKKKKQGALAGPEMDMTGCDGGLLKCFLCGDVGHFARNCQKKKSDALLPLNAGDDEEESCLIPTLEEAEKMAQGVLAIRSKQKKDLNNQNDNNEDYDKDDNNASDDNESDNNDSSDLSLDSEDELLLEEGLKLEEYVKKIEMQEYLDSTSLVKPYFKLKEDGSIIDTPKEVFETLSLFGHSKFRGGQEQAIMRILSGKSTLVTLSTGSGKSLCYQLPAYLYSKKESCISLIISPLVSLMEDQVVGLPPFLKAACLHTNQTKTQREKIKELINSGALSILLVSPEAVVSGERSSGFGSFLRQLPPIAFACIDEAHCVSQWSHNFRPSYLMICRILRERLGVSVILGLTATATRSTSDNIVDHLQIIDRRDGIISDVPLPNNLRLTVSKDGNRDHALLGLLLSENFSKYKSVIVYCTRRQECERIAAFLRTSLKDEKVGEGGGKKRKRMSCQAEPYHAGMAASRRRSIQKSFMSGELKIVVATVAFGMGINKCDIRAVIHYNMPSSFEGYVQEVGRAGRDGLPAHCHLFLDCHGNDENELRRHIYANSIDRHVIRKLLKKIFIPCSCKTKCSKHEVAFSIQDTVTFLDVPEENIATLLCYLELHENRYVEVLSPAYINCKIISYSGSNKIKKAAKDCPPLAMALALYGKDVEGTVFEFPVVDVAAAMGWDSGICKHKLKNLEWMIINNQPKRSNLSVQFTNLGFRVLAPGNLNDNQLDEALDSLYTRVKNQEKQGLLQLHSIHSALTQVSEKSFKSCLQVSNKEIELKKTIRQYFESPEPLKDVVIKMKPINEDQIINDTRQIIAMYRDNNFTGRAIARIFYGIQSPNYPAFIWGKCKFWRSHLKEDFDEICKVATREIINMRT
nr:ATP-dependent DNA helicase Q4 [Onthophagus taurus]